MTNAEARFNKIHIRKVYACLAVTCHPHFWQNDRDFLRATAVTRGWNGYRNKSQHRKLTLEKKNLPPFQQGFEPATFQSRVRCSNHWAIPAPLLIVLLDDSYIYMPQLGFGGTVFPSSILHLPHHHFSPVDTSPPAGVYPSRNTKSSISWTSVTHHLFSLSCSTGLV